MLKSLKWFLFILIAVSVVTFAQKEERQSSIPQRETVLVRDLKEQIGDCNINLYSEQKYEAALVAKINELDTVIASLKLQIKNQSANDESK